MFASYALPSRRSFSAIAASACRVSTHIPSGDCHTGAAARSR
jgi:hypothetical protein